jgi:glutathione S-transferase
MFMERHRVTLWHILISHYSEKARWALDWKAIEHERRSPPPPSHMAVSLWLSRGRTVTFPVLELDGRRIPDSTAIIAALEESFPDPALYPADARERERALELEDWFDEELGPHIRRFVFHEARKDRERFAELSAQAVPVPRLLRRPSAIAGRAFTALRFGAANDTAAEASREKVLEALDRLEAELGASDYLVGDTFTVADLTAAALFYPLVLPPEGPLVLDGLPESLVRFREPLVDRLGFRWVEDMFRRHRRRGAARAAAGHAAHAAS